MEEGKWGYLVVSQMLVDFNWGSEFKSETKNDFGLRSKSERCLELMTFVIILDRSAVLRLGQLPSGIRWGTESAALLAAYGEEVEI